MCYSAKVWQKIKEYQRRLNAVPDYGQMELLFRRRLTESKLRIPRAFDSNFTSPSTEAESTLLTLAEQYRQQSLDELVRKLFEQKTRLSKAQTARKTKETKKAREDERIATKKVADFTTKIEALKSGALTPEDSQIFPFHYAPIVVREAGQNRIVLARYHCRQPGQAAAIDRKFPTLYNARRDNIENYWGPLFGKSHAVVVMDAFFENVERDGKNAVLQFVPRPARPMFVAALYSRCRDEETGGELVSFAAVTDAPPAEVAAAGHDRCVVNLKEQNLEAWLTPQGRTVAELQAILGDVERPYYEHQVLAA